MTDDFIITFQIPRIRVSVEIGITLLGFQNPTSRGPDKLQCAHLAVHMTTVSSIYPNVFWALLFTLTLSIVPVNRSNGPYYYVVALFQRDSSLPLLACKIFLCLIFAALSFFPSYLSVGFCALWISISTLHSSSPENSSCF